MLFQDFYQQLSYEMMKWNEMMQKKLRSYQDEKSPAKMQKCPSDNDFCGQSPDMFSSSDDEEAPSNQW